MTSLASFEFAASSRCQQYEVLLAKEASFRTTFSCASAEATSSTMLALRCDRTDSLALFSLTHIPHISLSSSPYLYHLIFRPTFTDQLQSHNRPHLSSDTNPTMGNLTTSALYQKLYNEEWNRQKALDAEKARSVALLKKGLFESSGRSLKISKGRCPETCSMTGCREPDRHDCIYCSVEFGLDEVRFILSLVMR